MYAPYSNSDMLTRVLLLLWCLLTIARTHSSLISSGLCPASSAYSKDCDILLPYPDLYKDSSSVPLDTSAVHCFSFPDKQPTKYFQQWNTTIITEHKCTCK